MVPTAVLAAAARSHEPPAWFLPAFPLLFVGMWIVASTVLGFLAGHMTLLARFPPVDEPEEESFGWASGRVRGVSFSNALHVGIGARGLHLAANWLFRPVFRRQIPCIPWRELRLVRAQSEGMLARFMGSKFEIQSTGIRFTLGGAAGRAVERKLASPGARAASSSPRSLVRET